VFWLLNVNTGSPCYRRCSVLNEYFLQRRPMQIHFTDFVTAANLLVLLGIYRKMSIIVYQHKLMWTDFADRKGISSNGKHAASV
jgi:hypothetical protein